jgi:ribonuclease D
MTNDEGSTKARMTKRIADFVIPSTFDIRHSSLIGSLISTSAQLAALLSRIEPVDRIALDTEADSLHCYREKLCLLQISVASAPSAPGYAAPSPPARESLRFGEENAIHHFIIDTLADVDLAPLREVLDRKEIVLHGADYDLRLLRRGFNFVARRVFDTVIAARLLGIREFSLAALLKQYFDVELTKGSQKSNWAQRPLSARMIEYAINDTRYLLPLADLLEVELKNLGRFEWFEQSCQRAIEQAGIDRPRDADESWRITGSGALRGRAAAILRELWRWREKEAEAADRPPFHILQNRELVGAAEKFAEGDVADYRHFSPRRRQTFREAAARGTQITETDWPAARRRFATRPSSEIVRRTEELKARRDRKAADLGLEPSFVAPRTSLEAIAAEEKRAETLLVPWQRKLLGLDS